MKPWQVCSLELAKKLKELNVKQKSAFYWMPDFGTTWEYSLMNASVAGSWKGHFVPKDGRATTRDEDMRPAFNYIFAAFTVAELGEMLPREYFNPLGEESGLCRLNVFKNSNSNEWAIAYDAENMRVVCCVGTEADARAKCLIYLIENKIVSVEEINRGLLDA